MLNKQHTKLYAFSWTENGEKKSDEKKRKKQQQQCTAYGWTADGVKLNENEINECHVDMAMAGAVMCGINYQL